MEVIPFSIPENPTLDRGYEASDGEHLFEIGNLIPAPTDNRKHELLDRNARMTASESSMKLKIIRTIDNHSPRRDK